MLVTLIFIAHSRQILAEVDSYHKKLVRWSIFLYNGAFYTYFRNNISKNT